MNLDGLVASLEDIVGASHVAGNPSLSECMIQPRLLVWPASREEVAECLRLCQDWGASVVPAGAGTWLDGGNTVRSADVVVSLRRMNRVIEYSPPDLTATVEAGVTLTDLNQSAKENLQWLPLDPPGDLLSTLGGIVACGSSGPLRFGFGTARDYTLGLSLAHADGTVSKSGGKVVKNVAGYDMTKLYGGSFGTLAVITQVTLKLRPLPDRSATVFVSAHESGELLDLAKDLLSAAMRPASLFVLNKNLSARLNLSRFAPVLLVRFLDGEIAVRSQIEKVTAAASRYGRAELLPEPDEQRIWRAIADLDREADTCLKVSAQISLIDVVGALAEEVAGATAPESKLMATDAGAGIIRLAFDADPDEAPAMVNRIRDGLTTLGATVFLERAAAELKDEVGAWNDPGPAGAIMRTIKDKLDPKGILSPGRMTTGV